MKIELRQLYENPYRHLGELRVLDQKKIESLAASIRTTGFWDNLIVRKATDAFLVPTHYEIAYGHHRLAALQLLVRQQLLDEYYELELPLRQLDDNAMVRIMVTENQIERQAVGVVRQYIANGVKEPVDSITADDICQFVGADWWEQRKKVAGVLKKIIKKS